VTNETEIDEAIKKLAEKSGKQDDAGQAMDFSQAVLNMAKAKATLRNNEKHGTWKWHDAP